MEHEYTSHKSKTKSWTTASDSINAKSNSWVLFERDLFHFDAPAFEHNKRDIAFKHILSSSCAAASVMSSLLLLLSFLLLQLPYNVTLASMLLHEQSSFDSLLYFSLCHVLFLRVLASTSVSVFFVCSRLFNINGNGSNVHTQFMNAFEYGVLWHFEIKKEKKRVHCELSTVWMIFFLSLSLECYVSMLLAQVEMVLKYYIAVIHWSLFEPSSQPSAKWAPSAQAWELGISL